MKVGGWGLTACIFEESESSARSVKASQRKARTATRDDHIFIRGFNFHYGSFRLSLTSWILGLVHRWYSATASMQSSALGPITVSVQSSALGPITVSVQSSDP